MGNGGLKNSPMPVPIAQQNHASIDPNQVELLKSFYGNACLDPNKVHPSLLQTLRGLEKEDPCKNYFIGSRTSHDPNVRKDSSKSSCMKEYGDPMRNGGDGQRIESIEEEWSSNLSRHHSENLQT